MAERHDLVVALTDGEGATADRVGAKVATLARLHRAGLPVPDGVCLIAEAYRRQLARAGLAETAGQVAGADPFQARRLALGVRLGFARVELDPVVAAALAAAWTGLAGVADVQLAVRSSALCEDTASASFAAQFETFLGIAEPTDLVTAVRACWASLWSTRALRYMRAYEVDPAQSAMPVLIQKMVDAEAAGGAFSLTPEDQIVLTGTWGLGSAVAQGDVIPDRYLLGRDATLQAVEPGRKEHRVAAAGAGPRWHAVERERVEAPCLTGAEAAELARLVLAAEGELGSAVEIEWAKDGQGFWILQARPLRLQPRVAADELWSRHPALTGQPAGIGWGTGPACLVLDERDLERVTMGSIVVTQVGGPALAAVLPLAAGVVAELGGSTSHLAALARERGIPAVLGARGATRRIPEGATVAVDGITGVVRWVR
ncbi:MAG TPA: PEP/pyruvate-binding domain-containing protein [Methylomirabilota bacterium]|nr:PEP/pyruvate-binding domain-containing protein [Methylomirabilota bacterium]